MEGGRLIGGRLIEVGLYIKFNFMLELVRDEKENDSDCFL